MGVRLAAHDREGRERLFRYGARPPFALERFSELADGRIAYRLKAPNRRGQTHRVMTRPAGSAGRLRVAVRGSTRTNAVTTRAFAENPARAPRPLRARAEAAALVRLAPPA
ncbi:hypothetical protein [Sorangium sp. So ce291]|uniref:hypothetical protein n=1 Tax=Sorangium sp. So ce291 TaxID=3133294 RepID=UPI003F62C547